MELLKMGVTIEAQEKIMELREAAMELQEENLKLRERVQQLETEMNRSKNLLFEAEMYWLLYEKQEKEGPFCSVCYDKDNKFIRLHDGTHFGWKWRCPVCIKGWIEHGRSTSPTGYGRIRRDRSINL